MISRPSQPTFGAAVTVLVDEAIGGRGTNASELGRAAGISQSTMSRTLKGERDFTLDELAAICDALGIDMCELLKEADAVAGDRIRPARIVGRRRGA